VGLSLTAWRLSDATGQLAQCIVNERDRRWQLIVRQGQQIVLTERCASDDEAFARATEIWKAMIAQGWTQPEG
jgi:hypothetical protein